MTRKAGATRHRVYADENINRRLRRLTEALRQRGFDVLTAVEAGTLGQDDDTQLAFAAALGRVLLTFNRRDFCRSHAAFLATGRQHAGIVLLPQSRVVARSVLRAAMLLDWLALQGDAPSPLLNWNDLQHALHAGLRLPGYGEHDLHIALGRAEI